MLVIKQSMSCFGTRTAGLWKDVEAETLSYWQQSPLGEGIPENFHFLY